MVHNKSVNESHTGNTGSFQSLCSWVRIRIQQCHHTTPSGVSKNTFVFRAVFGHAYYLENHTGPQRLSGRSFELCLATINWGHFYHCLFHEEFKGCECILSNPAFHMWQNWSSCLSERNSLLSLKIKKQVDIRSPGASLQLEPGRGSCETACSEGHLLLNSYLAIRGLAPSCFLKWQILDARCWLGPKLLRSVHPLLTQCLPGNKWKGHSES